jgi:gamma-glutamyltranspeptidase / glutathione hydrolase
VRVALAHQEWELGDPDVVDVPVAELRPGPQRRPGRRARQCAAHRDQPRGGTAPNTTHLTTVDADGTMVSMTNTVTNY